MSVNEEQVRHVAKLARLALSDAEIDKMVPDSAPCEGRSANDACPCLAPTRMQRVRDRNLASTDSVLGDDSGRTVALTSRLAPVTPTPAD